MAYKKKIGFLEVAMEVRLFSGGLFALLSSSFASSCKQTNIARKKNVFKVTTNYRCLSSFYHVSRSESALFPESFGLRFAASPLSPCPNPHTRWKKSRERERGEQNRAKLIISHNSTESILSKWVCEHFSWVFEHFYMLITIFYSTMGYLKIIRNCIHFRYSI